MALKRGKTGQGYDQHVPPDVPPLKHLPPMFADVRIPELALFPNSYEHSRTTCT